jgi:hypothetical protein
MADGEHWTWLQSQTADDPCGVMYTVGYYTDNGEWIAESDWGTVEEARRRCLGLDGRDDTMMPLPGHPVADVFVK